MKLTSAMSLGALMILQNNRTETFTAQPNALSQLIPQPSGGAGLQRVRETMTCHMKEAKRDTSDATQSAQDSAAFFQLPKAVNIDGKPVPYDFLPDPITRRGDLTLYNVESQSGAVLVILDKANIDSPFTLPVAKISLILTGLKMVTGSTPMAEIAEKGKSFDKRAYHMTSNFSGSINRVSVTLTPNSDSNAFGTIAVDIKPGGKNPNKNHLIFPVNELPAITKTLSDLAGIEGNGLTGYCHSL